MPGWFWWLLGIAIWCILIYLTGSRLRRFGRTYPPARRLCDRSHPGWTNLEDGMPGGPRGRVWTELERDEYREKQRNKVIRIQTRMW